MRKIILTNIILIFLISFFSCSNEPDVDLILNNMHDSESENYIPTAPFGFNLIHSSEDSVVISWKDKSIGESGFVIERAVVKNSYDPKNYEIIGKVGENITRYKDTTNIKMNVSYFYKVRAFHDDTVGNDNYNHHIYVYLELLTPTFKIVKDTWSKVENNNAYLYWNDNSTAEKGFILKRSINGKPFEIIDSLPANTTSYIDHNLDSMSIYQYRIQAFSNNTITPYEKTLSLKRGFRFYKKKDLVHTLEFSF